MQKALLHVCCAPCATAPARTLASSGFEPVLFFYNPNIHPECERLKRLDEAMAFARSSALEITADSSGSDEWEKTAGILGPGPEGGPRCLKCFRLRLGRTAAAAAGMGIGSFATTLTVSPHKRASLVFQAGREAAASCGVRFLETDFKKKGGFQESVRISKELGLARQDYCGCRYSLRGGPEPERRMP